MLAIPTLHPAQLIRTAEDTGSAKFHHTVIGDLIRARELRTRKPNWDESVIWKERQADGALKWQNLFPTVLNVAEFCRRTKGKLIAPDVECTGPEPMDCQLICVGIASENGDAICVPFMRGGGDHFSRYWSPGDEKLIMELLCGLFGDAETPKVFQNGAFDTTVLWMNGIMTHGWVHDTLQAHHCFDGEMPHRLDFIASTLLEIPYWKDEVKGDIRWLDLDPVILRSYNLRDCLATLRVMQKLLPLLEEWGLMPLYRSEIAQVHVMRKATWRGVKVDLERRDATFIVTEEMLEDKTQLMWPGFTKPMTPAKRYGVSKKDIGEPAGLRPRMEKMRTLALAQMRAILGRETFNPASHPQLKEALYETLKFPIVARSKKTGEPATDKNALVLLGLFADNDEQRGFLGGLIRFRKSDKILSTYVEGLPILRDGRLHVSWKLQPVTGRFASSPNAQNWNAWIKRIFCAGEGHTNVSVDLSQAELRKMAYYATDPDLLEMYATGVNVHTANTCLLFSVRAPDAQIIGDDQINAQTIDFLRRKCREWLGVEYDQLPLVDMGDPKKTKETWKAMRTLSKNFVFGDNYGAQAETLFNVIRAKRDPNTDELLFPTVQLGQIEAMKITWEKFHPAIPAWWERMVEHVISQGFYRSPLSGRIRRFRGGFKRNEMLNFPIQEAIAAHMARITEVHDALERATGDTAVINLQVHDMVNIESPDEYADVCGEILLDVFNKPYDFEPPPPFQKYKGALLPADAPTTGLFLDEI